MRLALRPACLNRTAVLARLPRATPHSPIHQRIVTTSCAHKAPVDIPKLIVAPGSIHHNTLPSYLEYAAHKNLRPTTTVFIGTHYEYTVAAALQRLGFSLIRTGRKNDAGIDLIGHWALSFLREPLPVIVQCKARKARTSTPHEIRELEGSLRGTPPEWRRKDVLGMLVSTSRATPGVRDEMHYSPRPLAFLQISDTGTITQFLWNRAATNKGLEGVGVISRYTPVSPDPDAVQELKSSIRKKNAQEVLGKAKTRKRNRKPSVAIDIQLSWMGTPIFPESVGISPGTVDLIPASALADDGGIDISANEEIKSLRKRGRPPGSKNRSTTVSTVAVKRGPGRPRVKNTQVVALPLSPETAKRSKRGRPPGSKNKPKVAVPNE